MSNTITAFFTGRVGVCESVYQYDYGMVMILDGVNFGSVFDAYFQTTGEGHAIPVIGTNNKVPIPDSCLQKPGVVTLHIPVHTGVNDSEVEYIVSFKVINRARPVYDGTPAESTAIAKAIAALQNIQGDVDAWLDNHPEVVTAVQDGSITFAKLSSDINKMQIVENYSQLLETVADKVLVIHNDSPLGDGNSCIFEIREGESQGGHARDNGSIVFAALDQSDLQASKPPVKSIADVATSYYDRDTLIYGNDHTMFNEDTTNEIDCSSYVCAILQGIRYEASKYNGGSNMPGVYIGSNKIPSESIAARTNALLTWELAEWFAERKQLYSLSNPDFDTKKIQFGDVLFFSSHVDDTRFLGIDHCAMVVQVYPDDTALIIQAGGAGNPTMTNNILTVVKTSQINMRDYIGQNIVAFARPAYGEGDNSSKRINADLSFGAAEVSINAGGTTFLTKIYLKTALKPRTLYSVNLKGKLPDWGINKAWLFARLNQSDVSKLINFIRFYLGEGDRDAVWTLCGVTPGDLGTNPTEVDIYANGADNASGTAQVEYASLYEGIEYKDPSRNPVAITSSIDGFANDSYEYNGSVFIKCDVPLTGLSPGVDIEIAKLPSEFDSYATSHYIPGYIGYTDTVPIRVVNGKMWLVLKSASTVTLRIRAKIDIF